MEDGVDSGSTYECWKRRPKLVQREVSGTGLGSTMEGSAAPKEAAQHQNGSAKEGKSTRAGISAPVKYISNRRKELVGF